VTFSPDGRWLVSGSDDQTIKLWDTTTWRCLTTLSGHTSRVWSLAFSGDGGTLASGGRDGSIRIWDMTTGECQRVLYPPRPYEGMNITGATGLTDAQRETLKALGAVEDAL
jgi:WD40 repeat protein